LLNGEIQIIREGIKTMGMTISDAIRIGMANGIGEARRQAGMSYSKLVPVPNTIADAVDLAMNHKKYGLTGDETAKALDMINGRSKE
jgi:hypothetical protein